MLFQDRRDAGRRLATRLMAYARCPDVLILALPRGGVPVAAEVAHAIRAPLDVFLVRKLGVPGREELAMGAIASGGVRVLNRNIVHALDIPETTIDAITLQEQHELESREQLYRDGRPTPNIRDRTVILIDDGLATGSTIRAAVAALRLQHPARIVAAVPVAAASTCADLGAEVDKVVCLETPDHFRAVSMWYDRFSPTTDKEVQDLLAQAAQELTSTTAP